MFCVLHYSLGTELGGILVSNFWNGPVTCLRGSVLVAHAPHDPSFLRFLIVDFLFIFLSLFHKVHYSPTGFSELVFRLSLDSLFLDQSFYLLFNSYQVSEPRKAVESLVSGSTLVFS